MMRTDCKTCEHDAPGNSQCIACIKAGRYVNYELKKR